MTESTTSASASESATYPSAYAPRAALPSAYSNRGGALHGRAASFDFIATTSNSGRHTSASKKSNVAFVSHQKQPSEQFDTIAAARLWLHSPSLVSNGSASASPAAAASPAVSSRGAFPIRPDSPQKAATRALSPAREAPTMPQRAVVAASAVTPAMPRQRSAKSTDNSAPGAFALRKSPPHANPRGSAAMRFPRSMSDGQAVPQALPPYPRACLPPVVPPPCSTAILPPSPPACPRQSPPGALPLSPRALPPSPLVALPHSPLEAPPLFPQEDSPPCPHAARPPSPPVW
ncbi:unnamed protein product [Closterium sp. NIES-65]|nr:unnamed protein product [Closterium sp. NIES-65]